MIFFRKKYYHQLTDNELIVKYSESGNTEYVGELFTRYSHLVYGVCLNYLKNRNDAKDAVLSIFENIIGELNKNKEINNFKNWLYTVTRNFCLIQIRTKNRSSIREKIFSEEYENKVVGEYTISEDESEFKIINEAIRELKKEQEICIELFYLKQKSYAEIVQHTGFTADQVKSYIQNGKRNLRNILKNSYEKE